MHGELILGEKNVRPVFYFYCLKRCHSREKKILFISIGENFVKLFAQVQKAMVAAITKIDLFQVSASMSTEASTGISPQVREVKKLY